MLPPLSYVDISMFSREPQEFSECTYKSFGKCFFSLGQRDNQSKGQVKTSKTKRLDVIMLVGEEIFAKHFFITMGFTTQGRVDP